MKRGRGGTPRRERDQALISCARKKKRRQVGSKSKIQGKLLAYVLQLAMGQKDVKISIAWRKVSQAIRGILP